MYRWFPGDLVFAGLIALQHLLAPQIRRRLKGREPIVLSLAGGMVAAYVFIYLLPELNRANAYLGRKIFLMALISFLLFYSITEYLQRRRRIDGEGATRQTYRLKLTQAWIYNWLIVYGGPLDFEEFGYRAFAVGVALLLHLMGNDFSLGRAFAPWFDRRGRIVLALAPLAGWATTVVTAKDDKAINDIFVAFLAGTMLYTVFSDELPDRGKARFGWFMAGVSVFLGTALIILE